MPNEIGLREQLIINSAAIMMQPAYKDLIEHYNVTASAVDFSEPEQFDQFEAHMKEQIGLAIQSAVNTAESLVDYVLGGQPSPEADKPEQ